MKRQRRMAQLLLAVGLLVAACMPLAWAESVPQLQGRVNDYARMLSDTTERQLEAMLADLERTDGTQIAVLTITSLEGEPIEAFSMRVAEQWGIGQKQNDNGALLVIAKNDRKIRIEVGYGLEGRLTDLATGRIIRNAIGPQFKTGRFDQGVIDGVSAMIATAKGEYTAPERPAGGRGESHGSPGVFGLIVFFFLLNVVGRVNRLVGGVAGAVLAPIGGLFFGLGALALLALIPAGFMAGFLVSLLGPALSFGHGSHRSRGGTYWGGGGGFSSGGGFGGFSGGGGGFGGGGSSGSW